MKSSRVLFTSLCGLVAGQARAFSLDNGNITAAPSIAPTYAPTLAPTYSPSSVDPLTDLGNCTLITLTGTELDAAYFKVYNLEPTLEIWFSDLNETTAARAANILVKYDLRNFTGSSSSSTNFVPFPGGNRRLNGMVSDIVENAYEDMNAFRDLLSSYSSSSSSSSGVLGSTSSTLTVQCLWVIQPSNSTGLSTSTSSSSSSFNPINAYPNYVSFDCAETADAVTQQWYLTQTASDPTPVRVFAVDMTCGEYTNSN